MTSFENDARRDDPAKVPVGLRRAQLSEEASAEVLRILDLPITLPIRAWEELTQEEFDSFCRQAGVATDVPISQHPETGLAREPRPE
jgi:hypothetical protein